INLSNGQVGINLGNFSLGGPNDSAAQKDLRALAPAGDPTAGLGDLTSLQVNLSNLANSVDQQLTDFANNNPGPLGDAATAAKGALDQLTSSDGIQMSFPIFQDPGHSGFELVLGGDVDFVRFAAHFHFDAEEDVHFPLFGLDVGFGGQVHIDAALTLAYDTFGIREFLNDPQKKGADFLDGLYIDNTP